MTPRIPVVVVLRPLGLGDFLTGVPAYRAIARAFPAHQIVLAAPRVLQDLAMISEAFDRLVPTAPLEPLAPCIREADVAVDLHGRGPASQRILLESRPARLVSFANAAVPETLGFAEWNPSEHEIARWCRMLEFAGIPARASDSLLKRPPPVPGTTGATIVHPGAASGSRRWPAERFAAIARDERRDGRRVLITGGEGERDLALHVARLAGLPSSEAIAGSSPLIVLSALVAHAGRVICGDTGVSHLASAFATPSITLFGPTPPRLWGPPASPLHRVIWRGATGDPHGDKPDAGLLAISVADVRAELGALDREARRPAVPTRATTASGEG